MNMLAGFIGTTLNPYTTQNKDTPIPITSVWFGTIRHKKKKCISVWNATYTYNPWTREIQIHYNGKKYSPSGFAIAHYVAEQPLRSAAANGWVECEVFVENKWVSANYLREISPPKPETRKTNPKPIVKTNGDVDVEKELANASTDEKPKRTPLVEYDSESDDEDFEIVQNPNPESSTNTHNAQEPVEEYESDSEEMEVIQITIGGSDYFLNENTGDIYDPETQEVVGNTKYGKHNLF